VAVEAASAKVDDPAVEAKAVVVGAPRVPAVKVDAPSLAPNPKR
tara:strand:- start:81 stop:212 length:132 start_codon:yes stop_codon:yes gene_type:complete